MRKRNQIVYEFNAPIVDRDISGTIVNLLEAQVARTPNATALCFQGDIMVYGELNRKANQLAHYLTCERQVKIGDRIGLYLERSPNMIIGFLAVLKSGATYVPLDPQNPLQRVDMLIEDSDMCFVLTDLPEMLTDIKSTDKIID